MLQTVIIAMTVVGCNHQATQCERLPQPATHWENRSQCEAKIPSVVRKPDYPIIIVRCDEKVVVAIAGAPDVTTKVNSQSVNQKQLGEPLNINPLKSVQAVKLGDDQSVVSTVMRSTKHGFIFVREGAWGGYEKLRDGTAVGYSRMRGGVGAMVAATVKFARRTAGVATNFIRN